MQYANAGYALNYEITVSGSSFSPAVSDNYGKLAKQPLKGQANFAARATFFFALFGPKVSHNSFSN